MPTNSISILDLTCQGPLTLSNPYSLIRSIVTCNQPRCLFSPFCLLRFIYDVKTTWWKQCTLTQFFDSRKPPYDILTQQAIKFTVSDSSMNEVHADADRQHAASIITVANYVKAEASSHNLAGAEDPKDTM